MRVYLVLAVICLLPGTALAHKVGCFAAVEGERVAGYAWLGGGARPKNVPFAVLAPDGSVLHEGKTNAEGEFSFVPTHACDHTIVIDAGEGHQARFTVMREELPADLPPLGTTATPVADQTEAPVVSSDSELEATVERAVSRQVAPLRRELAEFREKRRLQDILAGLGYIMGIVGIVFYMAARRRQEGK